MPGLLGGLEGVVRGAEKFVSPRRALIGAVGIASAIGSLMLHKKLDEARRTRRFLDEWHKAEDYNPRVVLLYHGDERAGQALKDALLDKGYGVLWVKDYDAAQDALRRVESISAIVADPAIGDKPWLDEERKWVSGYSKPVLKAPGKSGLSISGGYRIRRFVSRLEEAMRQEDDKAYRLLRVVLGYAETARGKEISEPAPPEVAAAVKELVQRRRFIMRADRLDAHRGGVEATLMSGAPIDPKSHYIDTKTYEAEEGLCMKPEPVGSLEEIVKDAEHFNSESSGQAARMATPLFYVDMGDGTAIVIREYFIGPTFANVVSMLASLANDPDSSLGLRNPREAIKRAMNAMFNIAVRYHKYKRETADGSRFDKSESVLEYYRNRLGAAYERLEPLIKEAGVTKDMLLPLLDAPSLNRKEWYGRVMDIALPNFKLRLGVEEPSIEELVDFYVRDKRFVGEMEIESATGVYDQGYMDRHYIEPLIAACFSSYGMPADSGEWIEHAKTYIEREYLARKGFEIPQSGMNRAVRIALGSLHSALAETGVIFPKDLAANFFLMSAYRLLTLTDNRLAAAVENEKAFAGGDPKPEDYELRKSTYLANVRAYSESLHMVALTGAIYFEKARKPHTFRHLWSSIEDAFREAKEANAANPETAEFKFTKPLALLLAGYAAIGRELATHPERISAVLEETRANCTYIVEFRPSV